VLVRKIARVPTSGKMRSHAAMRGPDCPAAPTGPVPTDPDRVLCLFPTIVKVK